MITNTGGLHAGSSCDCWGFSVVSGGSPILGPGHCLIRWSDGVFPEHVGRAECAGKVRSGAVQRLWESTALSLKVGPLACALGGGRAQDVPGLECRPHPSLSASPRSSEPPWFFDSDLDLAKGTVALRPRLDSLNTPYFASCCPPLAPPTPPHCVALDPFRRLCEFARSVWPLSRR